MTFVEILFVLSISALLMAIALPRWRTALDRISVHSAASDLQMLLTTARSIALDRHTAVALDFAGPGGAVRVRQGNTTLLSRDIAQAHGVELHQTRDSLAYSALGLGLGAANLSIIVRRRAAAETVFVSRLGRVR